MSRLIPALALAALLALAGVSAVSSQTNTPTPAPLLPTPAARSTAAPPDDYQERALVQLGNLRNVAGGTYQVSNISAATLQGYAALLADEIRPFANDVTPPPDFAPFHTRLFMALRPCEMASTILQRITTDVFSFLVAAGYTQDCYTAASDASVEWSRVTGTMPIFTTVVFSDTAEADTTAPSLATPTPAAVAPVAPVALGDAPVYGSVRWKLDKAENIGALFDDPNDNWKGQTTRGTFIVTEFTVEDTDLNPLQIQYGDSYDYQLMLEDGAGRRFKPSDVYYGDICHYMELNPGLPAYCRIVFEVASDAAGLSLVFINDAGEQTIPLGF